MNRTERPDCTSLCPMAHIACVLPVPGRPKASTLTPRSTKSPSASLTSCCLSFTGARSCSKVSQVLPAGSLDARLNLSTLLIRLSSASCSRTSISVGRASACPASLKRPTVSAARVGSLNCLHRSLIRSPTALGA